MSEGAFRLSIQCFCSGFVLLQALENSGRSAHAYYPTFLPGFFIFVW